MRLKIYSFYFRSSHPISVYGFTLIELSIVLVIIGLLVGGVLVGRDLIKAAQVRGTISQVDKYNSSVNTFRLKYNALPGDIPSYMASAFGLFSHSSTGTGYGDNNGFLEGTDGLPYSGRGENLYFWRHLSDANLVDGRFFTTGLDSAGIQSSNITNMDLALPAAKLSQAIRFVVYSKEGFNFFSILPISRLPTGGYTHSTTGIPPIHAYAIDVKMDDGQPISGTVQAKGITDVETAPTAAATATTQICTIGDTVGTNPTNTYNRSTGANDTSCGLRFRFN